ncbi:MAG TPA: exo-beta-N-acetylmuramidase NamZ domain-containing protein [Aromatoleum sp.]|uniref:exo-beta-N-acetylmuramidase NamZ domain-containing protein n=1 Tax=Aromatoleum sp. TaxID=2307007 RepID=UPI002B464013|nr:exo-beta-N-acetylmuramidase NamZ domain-containing protein [Aromatoleum sp.]HJV26755.1 exo-beta-N-acetylmuramidase NamZ domain-containing protein [Aromatoleum sp.]
MSFASALRSFALLTCLLAASAVFATRPLDPAALAGIESAVGREIGAGHLVGAVVLVGNEERVLYRGAFGDRLREPMRAPMTEDTIFDLASLTKPVATATAVMQLVEQGRLELDAPAARYWPEFAAVGKGAITLRQLLMHRSGLRADLDLRPPWSGRDAARRLMLAEKPVAAPGARHLYSDINFEVLGEIVERVSGLPLDVYCRKHIFAPLGMADTAFAPVDRARVAPTEGPSAGVVHDPTAARMGGIAGHAGVFSTAADLARFARMMLAGGVLDGVRVLRPESVEAMTQPQSQDLEHPRGLGWGLVAPFAANRLALPPLGAYGHTGFTGTAMWIDPVSGIYVIVLSSRLYPNGRGNAEPLRQRVATVVGDALGRLSEETLVAARPSIAPYVTPAAGLETGLDVMASRGFVQLRGLRVGLITNHTGRDAKGRSNVELMRATPGLRLVALFSPEHGYGGELDERVGSAVEPESGLPIHSLYGATRRPTPEMLDGLDALVFDIQDVGARFYTYITTMAYAMEAAAERGMAIYVLDRPDPITAKFVQGPVLDADRTSFTGYFPLPVRHGMTVGELARLFNREAGIEADLRVVPMRGYDRGAWFDQTGLSWIAPSPNLRTLTAAVLYPGVGLVEGANVSVGRGTDTPFELVGAPWIDAEVLAGYLTSRGLAGVAFSAVNFTPAASTWKNRACSGVRLTVTDRDALDSPALGIEIVAALQRLYPGDFRLDATLGSIGSEQAVDAIRAGQDTRAIAAAWQPQLDAFITRRSLYLLY